MRKILLFFLSLKLLIYNYDFFMKKMQQRYIDKALYVGIFLRYSLRRKLKIYNSYIFATFWYKPFII